VPLVAVGFCQFLLAIVRHSTDVNVRPPIALRRAIHSRRYEWKSVQNRTVGTLFQAALILDREAHDKARALLQLYGAPVGKLGGLSDRRCDSAA
jgi:hypothetical protein